MTQKISKPVITAQQQLDLLKQQLDLLKRIFLFPEHGETKERSASFAMLRIAKYLLAVTSPESVKCQWTHKKVSCEVRYCDKMTYELALPKLSETKELLKSLYGSIEITVSWTSKAKSR